MKTKKKSLITGIVCVVLVLAVLAGFFVSNYFDYIELKEIGENYTKVFWTNFSVKAITQAVIFVVFFVILYVNIYFVRKNLMGVDSSFNYLKSGIPWAIVSVFLALALSMLVRESIADKFLPYLNSEWFNLGDPIFHADVGYYVFQRPLYIAIVDVLSTLSLILIGVTVLSYFLMYARFDFYNMAAIFRNRGIVIHTLLTVILFFIIKAVSYKYMSEEILYNVNSEFVGANYVDMNVWLPYYKVIPALLVIIVVVAVVLIMKSRFKAAVLTVAVYPVTFLAVMVIAGAVQTLMVSPNEFAVEAPYLDNNIKFTRAAYDLDGMKERDFDVTYNLDGGTILENAGTINNIRITDFDQTIKAANQLQSIKNYYSFSGADIIPYNINGELTAVTTAARELDRDKLDDSAKNYINLRMKYTHGMGIVMNSVNRVTQEGQPLYMIKDIPPRSIEGVPDITQPRIYYGEQDNDYVIVNTKDKELDDLSADGYSYDGFGGMQLNLMQRLLYAFKLGDFNLLVSSQVTGDSKLLVNTNVVDRVKKVAPFITFDSDAGIVVDDSGRLKWVIDGYTTTDAFPYAQYYGDYNYIRNSVKAVVDAYDGTVTLYIIDSDDPIIKSYQRIYPTLFSQDSYPADLAQHVEYPETLFKAQVEILKKYHITDPSDFFQKKGVWAVANQKYEGEKPTHIEPYYSVMEVEKGQGEEFVLMIPLTLVNKDNMVAWFAVRCGMEHYGEMVVYHFPSGENIYGPYQIENRIDNDSVISQELTLWDSGGSKVVRGNVIVVPVDHNLLYVEPVYITSGDEESVIPEIKRVIVAYGDKIVSKPTIDEAIESLFGVSAPDSTVYQDESLQSLLQNAINAYDGVKNSAGSNNWQAYGEALQQLDEAIESLRQRQNEFATAAAQ